MGIRYFSFLISNLLLAACSGPNAEERKTPPPGLSFVPQIVVMLDAKIEDPWMKHSETLWGPAENLRIERLSPADLDEAKEQLRVWNGRGANLWILGPGSPQSAWKDLKLARRQDLRVFLWQPEGTSSGLESGSLALDHAALERLFEKTCAKRCDFVRPDPRWKRSLQKALAPPAKVWLGENSKPPVPAALAIRIEWDAVLAKLLTEKAVSEHAKRRNLDVFSGDLKVEVGSEAPPEWTALLKEWTLDELRRGAKL